MMRCQDCEYLKYIPKNNGCNRYYCINEIACKKHLCAAVMVSRCNRHSDELKIKTSPKWCPLRKDK